VVVEDQQRLLGELETEVMVYLHRNYIGVQQAQGGNKAGGCRVVES
jgi:hypothetical protein